jgi:hypothetical protein
VRADKKDNTRGSLEIIPIHSLSSSRMTKATALLVSSREALSTNIAFPARLEVVLGDADRALFHFFIEK